MCEVEGCDKPINRDGVCLMHKLKSVRFKTHALRAQREDHTTAGEIQREVIEHARADGKDIKQRGVTSPTSGPLIT